MAATSTMSTVKTDASQDVQAANAADANFSFAWLNDENLLRDEGVYFGLTEGDVEDKVLTIKNYFDEIIEKKEAEISLLEVQKSIIDHQIAGLEQSIVTMKEGIESLLSFYESRPHDFYRHLFGCLVYAGMVVFNYWLVYSRLKTEVQFPVLISTGVYLFGIMSLFHPLSFVYHSDARMFGNPDDQREKWKVLVEELAIPFVAAAFIIAWGHQVASPVKSGMLFLLIYFLFVFAGKGLLANMLHVRKDFQVFLGNRAEKRDRKRKATALKDEITSQQERIRKLSEDKSAIDKSLYTLTVESRVNSMRKETMAAYFKSEYRLAVKSRKEHLFDLP